MKYTLSALLGFTALSLMACGTPPSQTTDMKSETETTMTEPTVTEPTPLMTPLMTWSDLTNRPKVDPTKTIRFGDGETDIVDVWLPDETTAGEGPYPVVLMVHGGCWQKSIADRTLMNYAAEALRQNGLAVWNIEYRGVDEAGGGYPGTYQDAARAADALRDYAEEFNLDLTRVAGFGHSAGGHLVTWLAGRKNLPATSVLSHGKPLQMRGVVNSGGLADLVVSEPLTLPSCLADIKETLIGPATADRPDPLSDTSSDRLLPTGITIYSVNGARDHIAPSVLGEDFTAKVRAAGDKADNFIIQNEAHVELISPGSHAFKKQRELLKDLFAVD